MTAKRDPAAVKVMIDAYNAGQSATEIGRQHNLSKPRAIRILNEAGVTMRPPGNPRGNGRGAPPPNISGQPRPRPPKRAAKLSQITRLADLQPAQQDMVKAALEGFKEYVALRKVLRIDRVTP